MKKFPAALLCAVLACSVLFAQTEPEPAEKTGLQAEGPAGGETGTQAEGPAAGEAAPETDFDLLQNREGGVTITAYRGSARDLSIPALIGGQTVTAIGPKACMGKGLNSVIVPSGVQTIGFCAFAGNSLVSITLSEGLKTIDYEAFADNQLASAVLPESAASIGVRAFANNKLSGIGLPGRVSYIGKDAFAGNPLADITIGANRNVFTSQGFETSFVNYYASTGKKAGTYTKNGPVWSLN